MQRQGRDLCCDGCKCSVYALKLLCGDETKFSLRPLKTFRHIPEVVNENDRFLPIKHGGLFVLHYWILSSLICCCTFQESIFIIYIFYFGGLIDFLYYFMKCIYFFNIPHMF